MKDRTLSQQALVDSLESSAVKLATQEIVTCLTTEVWAGFGLTFINPIVSWAVSIVVVIIVKRIDWLTFDLATEWQTKAEGEAFISASKFKELVKTSKNPQVIKDAEAAEIYAFRKLIKLHG